MWVADYDDDKIYAYALQDKAQAPAHDFGTLRAAGNRSPTGIWSDGTTLWVADSGDAKIFAYNLNTKERDSARDFNTLSTAGNEDPEGIWSDGTTLWVADYLDDKLYAYDMASKARVPARDFETLQAAGNEGPTGIWSDGATLWVADYVDAGSGYSSRPGIYAYNMPPPPPMTAPGAATISSVTSRPGFPHRVLERTVGDASGITAYDLRHILTSDDETVDANCTVVGDAWATGSGALQYVLTGLTGGAKYDVQVRAVNAVGDGPLVGHRHRNAGPAHGDGRPHRHQVLLGGHGGARGRTDGQHRAKRRLRRGRLNLGNAAGRLHPGCRLRRMDRRQSLGLLKQQPGADCAGRFGDNECCLQGDSAPGSQKVHSSLWARSRIPTRNPWQLAETMRLQSRPAPGLRRATTRTGTA